MTSVLGRGTAFVVSAAESTLCPLQRHSYVNDMHTFGAPRFCSGVPLGRHLRFPRLADKGWPSATGPPRRTTRNLLLVVCAEEKQIPRRLKNASLGMTPLWFGDAKPRSCSDARGALLAPFPPRCHSEESAAADDEESAVGRFHGRKQIPRPANASGTQKARRPERRLTGVRFQDSGGVHRTPETGDDTAMLGGAWQRARLLGCHPERTRQGVREGSQLRRLAPCSLDCRLFTLRSFMHPGRMHSG